MTHDNISNDMQSVTLEGGRVIRTGITYRGTNEDDDTHCTDVGFVFVRRTDENSRQHRNRCLREHRVWLHNLSPHGEFVCDRWLTGKWNTYESLSPDDRVRFTPSTRQSGDVYRIDDKITGVLQVNNGHGEYDVHSPEAPFVFVERWEEIKALEVRHVRLQAEHAKWTADTEALGGFTRDRWTDSSRLLYWDQTAFPPDGCFLEKVKLTNATRRRGIGTTNCVLDDKTETFTQIGTYRNSIYSIPNVTADEMLSRYPPEDDIYCRTDDENVFVFICRKQESEEHAKDRLHRQFAAWTTLKRTIV